MYVFLSLSESYPIQRSGPLSISGQELVWGEGQSDRGWESGITTLTPHSFIVKVSALGGRESAKQGMQGSRRGR